jgi:thioredoxin 1
MKSAMRTTILLLLVLALGAVIAIKSRSQASPAGETEGAIISQASSQGLPKIICLGAGACVPCKMMEPVRQELRAEYAGRLAVEFHDVWKDQSIGQRFNIRGIPTTIFYDAQGVERSRGEGFMSKDQILSRFAQLGIELPAAPGDN